MSDLVLASASPIRATMLRNAGVAFRTTPSMVDEAAVKLALVAAGATPSRVAVTLAEEKALAVSAGEAALVVGADQTLDIDGHLGDKPSSLAEARERLMMLRGRVHTLHAAVSLARGGRILWRHVETARLTMRAFSPDYLDSYLATAGDAVVSSVGAYQLEGVGVQLFDAVEGDYFSILGMPLIALLGALRREGVLVR